VTYFYPMIKVMTFNLRYGQAEDGNNHWHKRKALALARIHAFAPDLLGLQECRDDEQAEFVKRQLPEYEFYGVQRGGEGGTALEMAPLLFRREAFQLLGAGCFWLSETPEAVGSVGWDAHFPRTATWAELLHRPTGQPLTFLNTHFDYKPQAIDGAARALQRWAQTVGPNQPLILTGDFNANRVSAAYRLLTAARALFDAYCQIHPDGKNDPTFHAFGQPEAHETIDWILASRHFRAIDAAIDRTHEGNRYPSDHYPVTAVLELSC
jgi:endonuclease/exonuclease/phosphatase family metal-dependent hydrolase